MTKYEIMGISNEIIPNFVDELKLGLLLLDFKISFCKQDKFTKFKNLSNSFCLLVILCEFNNFNQNTQDYFIRKVFSKINKNALYSFFVRETCLMLTNKEFDDLDEILKSFVVIGFAKSANISDDKRIIKIVLPDNTEIRYTNICKDEELFWKNSGNCHNITFRKIRKTEEKYSAAVVLEDNYLFGKYYHSFIIKDDFIYDYSHNIIMKYESYLKLINPKILICEDSNTILNNIRKLEEDKSFAKSNSVDILKYAMDVQKKMI